MIPCPILPLVSLSFQDKRFYLHDEDSPKRLYLILYFHLHLPLSVCTFSFIISTSFIEVPVQSVYLICIPTISCHHASVNICPYIVIHHIILYHICLPTPQWWMSTRSTFKWCYIVIPIQLPLTIPYKLFIKTK